MQRCIEPRCANVLSVSFAAAMMGHLDEQRIKTTAASACDKPDAPSHLCCRRTVVANKRTSVAHLTFGPHLRLASHPNDR
jgi:hypothetical protein